MLETVQSRSLLTWLKSRANSLKLVYGIDHSRRRRSQMPRSTKGTVYAQDEHGLGRSAIPRNATYGQCARGDWSRRNLVSQLPRSKCSICTSSPRCHTISSKVFFPAIVRA